MRLLYVIIALGFCSLSLMGQSVFAKYSYWQSGKPLTGYEYSRDSIISIKNGIELHRVIDSSIVYSPDGEVHNNTPIREILKLRTDSVSTIEWNALNPNLISPIDDFTHLSISTYKVEGETFDVYRYGYIGKIIDGDYAIYVSFKYGLLGDASLNWGVKSLLQSEEPMKMRLVKKLRKDKSFFIHPEFNEMNRIK